MLPLRTTVSTGKPIPCLLLLIRTGAVLGPLGGGTFWRWLLRSCHVAGDDIVALKLHLASRIPGHSATTRRRPWTLRERSHNDEIHLAGYLCTAGGCTNVHGT
mmetsp:Transcript_1517/g.3195  ORF Transcript_1517/g.3195 Transcript_1517/m.3195 type:complete len:103 (+) Transcript_1517:1107-1415(+)